MKTKKEFPVLETERFLLRQFTDADLPHVFHGLSHPDVIRHYGVSFQTLEETRVQMKWFADLENDGTGIWWAICTRKDELFCGAGGFNQLDRNHRKAEVGFWLIPEYWSQGIMQETMPVILNHAAHALNLHRIEGYVESDNHQCKRAIEKAGFVLEGTMRDCEFKQDRFISVDIYAMVFDNDQLV